MPIASAATWRLGNPKIVGRRRASKASKAPVPCAFWGADSIEFESVRTPCICPLWCAEEGGCPTDPGGGGA